MEYQLTVAGIKRTLPLVPITSDTSIASFVLLGDDELSYNAAKELQPRLPEDFDYIVTMESKGIPLAHDLSILTGHMRSIVLRKSVKSYMQRPITTTVNTITTQTEQKLIIDGTDAQKLKGKCVIIVDDVISTGGSLNAAKELLRQVGAQVVAQVAILAEGPAAERKDIIYLEKLPLFTRNGKIKQL